MNTIGTDCEGGSGTRARALVAVIAMGATLLGGEHVAEACGCLSPPAVTEGDYAVNQRAEQIIFEVEPGWVTAHVLISYAGAPESFAWIVPVPEVPELGLSPVSAFGLVDRLTAPQIVARRDDICPVSAWSCRYHEPAFCGASGGGCSGDSGGYGPQLIDGGFGGGDAGASGEPPPVTVVDQQVVGDYETVTFRAHEAAAATQWLRDNGFIVNQTTSIFMEPYVQANMVFVAIKLVPGAGVAAIKPLKLRYRAAFPMIPLVLTAVAAEPHLTVTAFVYGAEPYRPLGKPVVEVPPGRIATDPAGRLNYPMVLARTIDEGGGDAFAIEYRGGAARPEFGQGSGGPFGGCCGNAYDACFLEGNGQCECPRDDFDRADCEAQGDLVEGVALLDDLNARYTTLTRITTRVSPEEMRFDPTFEPDHGAPWFGAKITNASQPSLAACEGAVIDKAAYADIQDRQTCASVYCGLGSQCVTTAQGPACACAPGTVAQRFTDLDSRASVTCVPETPTVDLRAGGEQLPDACAAVSCGSGRCVDRNGVAVCACDDGAAAVAGTGDAPRCAPIVRRTNTPGALDFSESLRKLDVCAPPPPSCGSDGWLVHVGTPNAGVACSADVDPVPSQLRPPPKPTCERGGTFCQGSPDSSSTVPTIAASWLVLGLLVRRRRRGRA